ncbi:hypothetical protein K9N68_05895 [Kovacikia minuta CCNUW1]|uniref:hypothetical protein n=1 Tax=Kovacikia minuta TaxID=2931930 RepID=UPI001CD01136|nr:hypothetical protein [Kovacikia minuta]UBF27477.1 hypothetical protein K9N68_05895 [Kovacikia minuta CCNUW1]
MSSPSGSNSDQPIPLSQAHAKRRESQRIETTEDQLEAVVSRVVDRAVTAKIVRLENSINLMMAHFEAVKRGEVEDSALRVTTDHQASDLALAAVGLCPEDYYIYTCGLLAEKLNVRSYDVQQMIKKLKLQGDRRYHKSISTGKTSEVQKYSEEALIRMKQALETGEYSLPGQQTPS